MKNIEKTTFLKIKNESKTCFQEVPRPFPKVGNRFSDPRKTMGGVPAPKMKKVSKKIIGKFLSIYTFMIFFWKKSIFFEKIMFSIKNFKNLF